MRAGLGVDANLWYAHDGNSNSNSNASTHAGTWYGPSAQVPGSSDLPVPIPMLDPTDVLATAAQ